MRRCRNCSTACSCATSRLLLRRRKPTVEPPRCLTAIALRPHTPIQRVWSRTRSISAAACFAAASATTIASSLSPCRAKRASSAHVKAALEAARRWSRCECHSFDSASNRRMIVVGYGCGLAGSQPLCSARLILAATGDAISRSASSCPFVRPAATTSGSLRK